MCYSSKVWNFWCGGYFHKKFNQISMGLSILIWLVSYRNVSDVLWEAISTGQVLSLYQGLGTKNLQSFISQFIYFYGYSLFKRLYLEKSGSKTIGTKANLIVAAAAGACTVILTQVGGILRFYHGNNIAFHFSRWLVSNKTEAVKSPNWCPKYLGILFSNS